ncbi:MAG TPA: hypothetical protein ENJ35_07510 [Gammaproteobacteria bacterium]|nr:hypothetical protein [Gammaproteobacteria bacterium]
MKMNILKVFSRAGIVKRVFVTKSNDPEGWIVEVDVAGERIEPLERSRGGIRVFRDPGRVVSTLQTTDVKEVVFRLDQIKSAR